MQVDSKARGTGRNRSAADAAEDRAGGAKEGNRLRLEGAAKANYQGYCLARGAIEGAYAALAGRKAKARRRAEAQERARSGAGGARAGTTARRVPARGRTHLRDYSGTREKAEGDRGQELKRDGRGGGDARSRRAGGLALDRNSGRPDAGGRERKAAAHGRRARQARRRAGRGGESRLHRRPTGARRLAGSEPADRLVHVPRAHRRRKDRADKSPCCLPVRRRAGADPDRHVRVHGESIRSRD